jgi:hypothetical protein
VSSFLNGESIETKNTFSRLNFYSKYTLNKSWLGTRVNAENNKLEDIVTQNLSRLSQKFNEYEGFFGVGDSTKVFAEVGVNFRSNDSVKSNKLKRVSNAKTYYINSQLIKNKNSKLSLYANFRNVENIDFNNTKSLNSRVLEIYLNKNLHT